MPPGRDFFCGWTLLRLCWVELLLGPTAFSFGPWSQAGKKKKNQLLPTSSIPPNMIKTEASGTSLAVQRLGLSASTAQGTGSIPGWRTKILQAVRCGQIKKKKVRPLELDSLGGILDPTIYYLCGFG